jgi:hypothetical protein
VAIVNKISFSFDQLEIIKALTNVPLVAKLKEKMRFSQYTSLLTIAPKLVNPQDANPSNLVHE